jgi:outer membrane receptor protein involved in Fe transport
LDLLRRLNGSTNPNVIRDAPDAGQIALFTGTSLAPAGDIIQVLDPYLNLDSRVSEGWDFGMFYNLPEFGIGEFRLRFNAARLLSFVQSAGPDAQELLAGIADGTLPPDVAVGGLGELLEVEGRPKWRFSTSLLWSSGDWNASLFGQYVGRVYDTSVIRDNLLEVGNNPNINFFEVDDQFTLNAMVNYTFNDGPLDGTNIRLGMNNIFNEDPPLADESYGFFSELHSARGRVFRVEVRKQF